MQIRRFVDLPIVRAWKSRPEVGSELLYVAMRMYSTGIFYFQMVCVRFLVSVLHCNKNTIRSETNGTISKWLTADLFQTASHEMWRVEMNDAASRTLPNAVRLTLAVLFLLASSAKSFTLLNGLSPTPYFDLGIAEFEFALCVLLFINVYQTIMRNVLIVTFSCFVCKLSYSLLIGQKSCGCLGADFSIPPLLMLLLDIGILSVIVLSRNKRVLTNAT